MAWVLRYVWWLLAHELGRVYLEASGELAERGRARLFPVALYPGDRRRGRWVRHPDHRFVRAPGLFGHPGEDKIGMGTHAPEDRRGEGGSYMGLFPRTVGRRFWRARAGASRGPSASPSARSRGREGGGRPGGIMQDLASLSGTTTYRSRFP